MSLRAYIVDDEPLAVERLSRLLAQTGRVEVLGSATDPRQALEFLAIRRVDVLFLDIHMPQISGFELLAELPAQPAVVFTTAYDQYALQAFETNSVDYLLKPVDPLRLARALDKVERMCGGLAAAANLQALLRQRAADHPRRLATRVGKRICFLDLARVTHFYAADKLTYAVAEGKPHTVDHTLSTLEERLDPRQFLRIHRATLLNLAWVKDIVSGFAGTYVIRLSDAAQTELTVARRRVQELKTGLGF